MFNRLFSPSGGLLYHWKAYRFQDSLWRPFQIEINSWLVHRWNPHSKSIVLIGPSAGYQLSEEFLKRFEKIIVYEPDLFALYLLKNKFKKNNLKYKFFAQKIHFVNSSKLSKECLVDLVKQYPDSCFLFCNLLGQLPLIYRKVKESQFIIWTNEFESIFKDKEWASFHDVFSSKNEPNIKILEKLKILRNSNKKKVFLKSIFSEFSNEEHQKNTKIEVFDHKLFYSFAKHPHQYFKWQIEPQFYHVIAGVCCSVPLNLR